MLSAEWGFIGLETYDQRVIKYRIVSGMTDARANISAVELVHQRNVAMRQRIQAQGNVTSPVPIIASNGVATPVPPPATNDEIAALTSVSSPSGAHLSATTSGEDSPTVELGFDDEVEANSGALDWAADEFSFIDKVMHFLRGERIRQANRAVVEIALLIECGTFITDQQLVSNPDKYRQMKERYLQLIQEIPDEHFESQLVRNLMSTRLYKAQKDFTGDRLFAKFQDFRSECRTLTSMLPSDLASLPSGNQLHDLYKAFVLSRYKDMNVSVSFLISSFSNMMQN